MISSYAKVLIPNMGYNVFYSWQERSLLAVNGIPDSRNCVGTQILFVDNCRWISSFGIPMV